MRKHFVCILALLLAIIASFIGGARWGQYRTRQSALNIIKFKSSATRLHFLQTMEDSAINVYLNHEPQIALGAMLSLVGSLEELLDPTGFYSTSRVQTMLSFAHGRTAKVLNEIGNTNSANHHHEQALLYSTNESGQTLTDWLMKERIDKSDISKGGTVWGLEDADADTNSTQPNHRENFQHPLSPRLQTQKAP